MNSPLENNITRIKRFTELLSTLKASDLDAIDNFLDGLRGITETLPLEKPAKDDTQDMKPVDVDTDGDDENPYESTDAAPRNTVTNRPRNYDGDCYPDWYERQMRRAWGLFGMLVKEGVFNVPTFDFVDKKDVLSATRDIDSAINGLYFALEGILDEMNEV